ncbi:MAG: hypothetical protein HZA50_02465 [Planctomycetes bacterium]|nr:hypothetical protein [Planctomycetota bacterium]
MTNLGDIIGQDRPVGRLRQMLAGRRMPHALLLVGPDGVGKRTTATALAKILLCGKAGQKHEACGKCDDCRMMDAGTHADLHIIYKELAKFHDDQQVRDRKMQELSIDVVRDFLIEPAYRTPDRGRGKVFIVQDAELMSEPAQNALLKTLEEPPAGVTIILTAQRQEDLLATTISRCGVVRFGPLPEDFLIARLAESQISPPEAAFWAAFTGGSLGQAMRFSAMDIYDLKVKAVRRLGGADAAGAADFSDELVKASDEIAKSLLSEAKKAYKVDMSESVASRSACELLVRLIAAAFQDAMNLSASSGQKLVNFDQAAEIAALAGRFPPDQLARIVEQLSQYEYILWQHNVNQKLLWDNICITCLAGRAVEV